MGRGIFWISISFSLIFLFLAIFSTRFFAASLGLALVAILIQHSREQKDKRVDREKIDESLERIESLTAKLFNHLNNRTKNINREVEKTAKKLEKVRRDKKNMEGEMNRKLDKMAGKIIEVENKTNMDKKREKNKTGNKSKGENISPFPVSNSIDKMVKDRGKKK